MDFGNIHLEHFRNTPDQKEFLAEVEKLKRAVLEKLIFEAEQVHGLNWERTDKGLKGKLDFTKVISAHIDFSSGALDVFLYRDYDGSEEGIKTNYLTLFEYGGYFRISGDEVDHLMELVAGTKTG